ncbi:MAG: hypothetical protein ACR2QR_08460 [Woeseiaceae bacterium]
MTREDVLGPKVATFSGTVKSVRGVIFSLGLALVIILLVNGISSGNWDEIISLVPAIFLVWVAGAVLLALIPRIMRVHVHTRGVKGRSFGGFLRRILWDEIAEARYDGAGGMAAIVLIERDTRLELWMLREIAERSEFRDSIQPYIDWSKLEQSAREDTG